MPGPNSAPNGDTTIIRGHVNEEFVKVKQFIGQDEWIFVHVPKREWLAQRNRLRSGKTK